MKKGLLLEELPCSGKQGKRRAAKCRKCVDDYYDTYDAGNPSEPLYGLEGECGGKILSDVDYEMGYDERTKEEPIRCPDECQELPGGECDCGGKGMEPEGEMNEAEGDPCHEDCQRGMWECSCCMCANHGNVNNACHKCEHADSQTKDTLDDTDIEEMIAEQILNEALKVGELNERFECWNRGRSGRTACRMARDGSHSGTPGCMSYNECLDTEPEDSIYDGGNNRCIRHNGNQEDGYKPGVNRCLEWSGDRKGSPVDWWEDDDYDFSYRKGSPVDWWEEETDTIQVRESVLIDTIEKIVKEQMMLGFGNNQGMGLGIAKPSDKYDLGEDELDEDDTTGTTYNVNISNQSADPDYTADGMGIFENILKQNLKKYLR